MHSFSRLIQEPIAKQGFYNWIFTNNKYLVYCNMKDEYLTVYEKQLMLH